MSNHKALFLFFDVGLGVFQGGSGLSYFRGVLVFFWGGCLFCFVLFFVVFVFRLSQGPIKLTKLSGFTTELYKYL